MRPILLVPVLLLALSSAAAAQGVPSAITFTARLTDAGTPLDGAHDFSFSLYAGPTGGGAVWSEPGSGTVSLTVSAGLLFRELGADVPLDAATLDGSRRYLEITVDGTQLSPRIPILSVPYAVRADTAASAETLGTLTPGDILPVGASLSCSGTDRVSGIDGATGNVICAPASVDPSGDVAWSALSSYPACAVPGQAVTGLGDTVTCSAFDATADTIADDGVISDAEASDTLTVDATGSVTWAALSGYPACATAGQALTGLGDTVTCSAFDATADTIADDGVISDAEAADELSIDNGTLLAPAVPGLAAPDINGKVVVMTGQFGGPDGPDADLLGTFGGYIELVGGNSGAGRAGGDFYGVGGLGGDATTANAAGKGGIIGIFAGDGGFGSSTQNGGDGGDVTMEAGDAGGGFSASGGNGGTVTLTSGTAHALNGNGGNVVIKTGDGSGTGFGGEITLNPGEASIGGENGAVQIGSATAVANSTSSGRIIMHIKDGDVNLVDPGEGIIMKSPNGSTCRLLRIDNTGALLLVNVTCP